MYTKCYQYLLKDAIFFKRFMKLLIDNNNAHFYGDFDFLAPKCLLI